MLVGEESMGNSMYGWSMQSDRYGHGLLRLWTGEAA